MFPTPNPCMGKYSPFQLLDLCANKSNDAERVSPCTHCLWFYFDFPLCTRLLLQEQRQNHWNSWQTSYIPLIPAKTVPLEPNQTDPLSLQGGLPNAVFSIIVFLAPKESITTKYLSVGTPFQTPFYPDYLWWSLAVWGLMLRPATCLLRTLESMVSLPGKHGYYRL